RVDDVVRRVPRDAGHAQRRGHQRDGAPPCAPRQGAPVTRGADKHGSCPRPQDVLDGMPARAVAGACGEESEGSAAGGLTRPSQPLWRCDARRRGMAPDHVSGGARRDARFATRLSERAAERAHTLHRMRGGIMVVISLITGASVFTFLIWAVLVVTRQPGAPNVGIL